MYIINNYSNNNNNSGTVNQTVFGNCSKVNMYCEVGTIYIDKGVFKAFMGGTY